MVPEPITLGFGIVLYLGLITTRWYYELYGFIFTTILKSTIKNSIDEYKMILDKIKSIESYINYLSEKRVQLKKLIDSLTLSLENKYIDIVNNHDIYCAEEIHDVEIEKLKQS